MQVMVASRSYIALAFFNFNLASGHAYHQASVSGSGAILPGNVTATKGLMRRSGADMLHAEAFNGLSFGTSRVASQIIDTCLSRILATSCESDSTNPDTGCQLLGGRCRKKCDQFTDESGCEEYEHCTFRPGDPIQCNPKCSFLSTQNYVEQGDCKKYKKQCHESGEEGKGGYCREGAAAITQKKVTTGGDSSTTAKAGDTASTGTDAKSATSDKEATAETGTNAKSATTQEETTTGTGTDAKELAEDEEKKKKDEEKGDDTKTENQEDAGAGDEEPGGSE